MDAVLAIAFGLAGGAVGGLLGVGGGILFVPALAIFLDSTQVQAEATSLVVIVPVAIVGTWRQQRYGNVSFRDGVIMGVLSVPGVAAGVALANVLPQRALKLGFAGLALLIAAQLLLRAARAEPGS